MASTQYARYSGFTSSSGGGIFTPADLTDVGTDGITITGGTSAVNGSGTQISQHVADSTHNGYLSSTDWTTFNSKQAAGSYITALTGDVTATGPGSVAATLATVNGNVGSFGSSTSIPSFTVNAKGLITAASGNVVIAPAGTLTGTTLASNVVTSSLTSVGTITTGTWTGTTIAIANGGTGQTTASAAFNALSPMTTGGDLIYGGASGAGTRLANGSAGQVLQSNGTTTAPTWTTNISGNAANVTGTVAIANGGTGKTTKAAAFDALSPTTTKGDLIVFSTTNIRQAVGSNDQTLIADSAQTSGIKWGTLAIAGGGTGATTKAAAFDALSPMTTGGDIIYGGASGTGTRLANGSAGQVLTSNGTTTAPSWAAATFTAPTSEVWVYAVNGYGSTNTVIRKWTTVGLNTGSDITYTSSATNGDSFTVNATGKYAISYVDDFTSAQNLGVSVNSTQLTTNIVSITAADRRVVSQTPGANILTCVAVTLNLTSGDVVRAHTAGTASGSDTNDVMFRISRIG